MSSCTTKCHVLLLLLKYLNLKFCFENRQCPSMKMSDFVALIKVLPFHLSFCQKQSLDLSIKAEWLCKLKLSYNAKWLISDQFMIKIHYFDYQKRHTSLKQTLSKLVINQLERFQNTQPLIYISLDALKNEAYRNKRIHSNSMRCK